MWSTLLIRGAFCFAQVGLDIPKTDIEAKLEVSLPVDLSVEAGGSTSIAFESKSGFSYNSDDREFMKIDEDASSAVAKIEGKVNVSAGPQVLLSAQLMDFLDARIRGQIGIEADGNVTAAEAGGGVSTAGKPDSIHACKGCVDCDINLFAGVYGTLECDALENLDVKFFDEALFEVSLRKGV